MDREKLLLIQKYIGETPLEALERSRAEYSIPKEVPMTYAGRLDPMAEGLLLVLLGDECKKKDEYLGLSKEYEVLILLGFETDTGDLLGLIQNHAETSEIQKDNLEEILKEMPGKFLQEYPAFSSKTVNGTPLFELAKEGNLPEEFPAKEVEIHSIDLLNTSSITTPELLDYLNENIGKVKGDFRQDEILESWREALQSKTLSFPLLKIRVKASSGTYMRLLAQKIGDKLNTKGLAFSINRLSIGEFKLI